MEVKAQAKRAIPYSIGISVFNIVVALFGMVFLVRYLEAVEYGVLAILTGLPVIFNLLISFGYDQYILRYIPNISESKLVGDIIWRIVFKRMALAIIFSLLLIATFDIYSERFELTEYYPHLVIFQIVVVFRIGNNLLNISFGVRFLQKQVLLLGVIYQALRISAIIYGVIEKKDLQFFILAFTVAEIIRILLSSILFSKHFGQPRLRKLIQSRDESKEEKSYRNISYLNSLGTSFLGTDIDRYVLGYFSTNVQVAIYAIATKILTHLLYLYPSKMFKSVIEPAFYSKYDNSTNESDLNNMFQFLFNANTMIGFMFISIFYPLGDKLLMLVFEQKYIEQVFWPLLIFLIFIVFYAIPLGLVANAIKKPKILLYSKISVVVNIALGIPSAYYFGAIGMAAATAFSVTLKNAIIYLLSSKYVTIRLPWMSTWKALINALITLGVLYLLDEYLSLPVIISLVIGIIIYIVLLKVNPILTPDQKNLLLTLVPNKFGALAKALI